jgi:hypothetical protein
MATYIELRGAFGNDELRNRVVMATVIAAHELLGGTPTAADRLWASAVFSAPEAEGRKAFMSVLAANAAAEILTIEGATDVAIQAQVDAVVPQLVSAMAGV